MSLPEVEIPISTLLPSQPAIYRQRSLDYLATIEPAEFEPVKTVLYQRNSPSYILVDGHHRAYMRHTSGEESVKGVIASEDEHLEIILSGCFAIYDCFLAIKDIHRKYEGVWRRNNLRQGVTNIGSMLVEARVMTT